MYILWLSISRYMRILPNEASKLISISNTPYSLNTEA